MNLVHLILCGEHLLETLDFLPLTTVDYSGGMIIITDWYSDELRSNSESIKISLRFLVK